MVPRSAGLRLPVLLIQAIVLGLLQGLTEFLPVSSSGHLQGVPYLLGWPSGSLTFDVMVHAGTLAAVVVYFRGDLAFLATRVTGLGGDHPVTERRLARRTLVLLAVGSVPAALAGLLFEDVFAAAFGSVRAVSGFLLVTAFLLWFGERLRTDRAAAQLGKSVDELDDAERRLDPGRGEDTTTLRDAGVIGVAQALAIFPGISRSGSTIAAGMALGLSRAAAARFSFLLSIPVIVGAVVFKLPDLGTAEPGTLAFGPLQIAVGVLVAAASGYLAISFLLRLVQSETLLGFARYVVVFAAVLFGATFVLG
ncbi:undecaprenyl-diphosphate phosphatase [Egicoccus halophilus]|uniref:Undecaprenyl-diphosphatase n=1 Tax=Egicoccus halophilus TaxID=1670830 RepID=A0A8J3A7C7_9ACTN|nr:undecaprenyl-diphosphate phosphatase [Egicoccus halophilus]GGI03631.1 undecaprenyl-diphosphatase [Egicoccus halophilus]